MALEQYGWAPDLALVSSSRRTRETWRHLALVFPECRKIVSDDLYLAGIPAIERLLGEQAKTEIKTGAGGRMDAEDVLVGPLNNRSQFERVQGFLARVPPHAQPARVWS